MQVLYIPKTNGDDTLENGGGYSETVSNTFQPKTFPCGVLGGGSTNACCIKDMLESYRTPSAFADYMADTDMLTCPNEPIASGVVGEAGVHGFLEGKFSGMDLSEVMILEWMRIFLHQPTLFRCGFLLGGVKQTL